MSETPIVERLGAEASAVRRASFRDAPISYPALRDGGDEPDRGLVDVPERSGRASLPEDAA